MLQVQRVGLSEDPLALGPLGVFLQEVHRLLKFPILFDEGFHPLYQLVTVLGSPSYPLKINNDNDGVRSQMSKTNTHDSMLTSICFTTPARADFSRLISLGVSSSSTTTTSSPRLWKIRTDWVRGSARTILHHVLLFRSS